jgi:hypothetical protein
LIDKDDSIALEKYSWPTLIREEAGGLPAFHELTGIFNHERYVWKSIGNLKSLLDPTFNNPGEVMV